ncbi:hypothetical protein CYMTET_9571 [Cymbomonas tetramitiformis]|uniref:SET domain-containing protein n=1 Tax=Cymbomonas tetramitiformis TaxID=36881 RepID=A0AAE0GRH5_9CHLO|nr:hypothetical protein CYMTET_9571 [Cymbomonas tetramitiformis]
MLIVTVAAAPRVETINPDKRKLSKDDDGSKTKAKYEAASLSLSKPVKPFVNTTEYKETLEELCKVRHAKQTSLLTLSRPSAPRGQGIKQRRGPHCIPGTDRRSRAAISAVCRRWRQLAQSDAYCREVYLKVYDLGLKQAGRGKGLAPAPSTHVRLLSTRAAQAAWRPALASGTDFDKGSTVSYWAPSRPSLEPSVLVAGGWRALLHFADEHDLGGGAEPSPVLCVYDVAATSSEAPAPRPGTGIKITTANIFQLLNPGISPVDLPPPPPPPPPPPASFEYIPRALYDGTIWSSQVDAATVKDLVQLELLPPAPGLQVFALAPDQDPGAESYGLRCAEALPKGALVCEYACKVFMLNAERPSKGGATAISASSGEPALASTARQFHGNQFEVRLDCFQAGCRNSPQQYLCSAARSGNLGRFLRLTSREERGASTISRSAIGEGDVAVAMQTSQQANVWLKVEMHSRDADDEPEQPRLLLVTSRNVAPFEELRMDRIQLMASPRAQAGAQAEARHRPHLREAATRESIKVNNALMRMGQLSTLGDQRCGEGCYCIYA